MFAAALAICGLSTAQSSMTSRYTVRFATAITVAGTTIPAGECTIQVNRGSSAGVVLAIRAESGETVSARANRVNETATDTEGSPLRHDGAYQLDRILLPDHTAYQLLGIN